MVDVSDHIKDTVDKGKEICTVMQRKQSNLINILDMHDAMLFSTKHSNNLKAIDLTMLFQACP